MQVALRNAQQRLQQDDVAIDRARWAFNQAIGVDVNAPTEVADVRDRPVLPDDAEMLRTAQEKNPVLTALFERQRQLEAELSALERSRFPRFNAGGAARLLELDAVHAAGDRRRASSASPGTSAPTRGAKSASPRRRWRRTRTASSSRPSCARSSRACAPRSAPRPSA